MCVRGLGMLVACMAPVLCRRLARRSAWPLVACTGNRG
jgi:hypothetical protein